MKKTIFFAALACVALASCVSESENLPQENKGKLLTFSTPVMHNQTRNHVGEIAPGDSYPASEHFTVYAVEHVGDFAGWDEGTTPFFPAAGVSVGNISNTSHWVTEQDYYLPTEPNHKLSFAAYSPTRAKENGTITYGANGLKIADWRMPDENPYDLLYSERTINVTEAEVPIKFHHALSSIHFTFNKPSAPEGGPHSVIVTKLAIKGANICNKGTFQDRTTTANTTGTPIWDNLKSDNVPTEYVLFNDSYEVTVGATEITSGNLRFFMPIPQSVNSTMKMVLSYKIKQAEGNVYEEVNNLEIPFTSFVFDTDKHTESWEMNTRYFYNITFGALTKIYFHPQVSDWKTVENAGTFTIK